MPKIQRSADPDTFDFGKAVTLVISHVKELNKTKNTLVDNVAYLEGQEAQLKEGMTRLRNENAELLEVNKKARLQLAETKEKLDAIVKEKQTEIGQQVQQLADDRTVFERGRDQTNQKLENTANELQFKADELRTKENQVESRRQGLEDQATSIATLKVDIQKRGHEIDARGAELDDQAKKVEERQSTLNERSNRLEMRQKELAEWETRLKTLSDGLTERVTAIGKADHKNKVEAETKDIKRRSLLEKENELNIREVKLNDRSATKATHENL